MTADLSHDVVAKARAAAPFQLSRRKWKVLLAELARRGAGLRESGAFLLAPTNGNHVRAVAYYDDLDANCLTGGISFASSGFTQLWRICEQRGLKVVADVHTHPSRWVRQSEIDATNPMIARRGHVAVVVPNYGNAESVRDCGVHIYLGSHRWTQVAREDITTVVRIYSLFSRTQLDVVANRALRLMRRMLGKRR